MLLCVIRKQHIIITQSHQYDTPTNIKLVKFTFVILKKS